MGLMFRGFSLDAFTDLYGPYFGHHQIEFNSVINLYEVKNQEIDGARKAPLQGILQLEKMKHTL